MWFLRSASDANITGFLAHPAPTLLQQGPEVTTCLVALAAEP
jgi:hypothetical protein